MRRQRRSRELVPVTVDNCPSCDGDVVPRTVDQLPLLRHGGHGAVRRTITLHCARPCGWSLEKSVTEVSPRVTTLQEMSVASGNGDAGGFDRQGPRIGW